METNMIDIEKIIGRRKTPIPDIETVKDNEFVTENEDLTNSYYAIRFRNGDYLSFEKDKSLVCAIKFPISLTHERIIQELRKICIKHEIETLSDYVIVRVSAEVKVTSEIRSEIIKKKKKITEYNAFAEMTKRRMKRYL